MTKLAINEEREEDKYEHASMFKCWKCDPRKGKEVAIDEVNASICLLLARPPPLILTPQAKRLTDGVMLSLSSARQSEVKAWEEEITACEHTLCLEQLQSGIIAEEGNEETTANHDRAFISSHRSSALRLLRAHIKSLALSHLWCSWMRSCPIRWHWW
jgi:hypothetical protein